MYLVPCDSPGVCLIYVFRAIVETKLETKLVEFYILLLNFTVNSNGYTAFAQQQLGSTSYHIISVHPSNHPATLLSTLTHSSSIYSSIHSVCVDTVVHLKHLCLFACFNAIHTTSSVRSTNPTAISVFPHIKKPRPRFCCCPRALPRPSHQRCWTYCCRLWGGILCLLGHSKRCHLWVDSTCLVSGGSGL